MRPSSGSDRGLALKQFVDLQSIFRARCMSKCYFQFSSTDWVFSGAAVEAAREGLPAIAISADGDSTAQTPHTTLTSEPNSNLTKSAEVYSNLTVKFLAELLLYGVSEVLPKNTILNVNYPGTAHCPTVDSFKFVLSRVNENAAVPDVITCGSNHLPTEDKVIGSGCYVSVSVVDATNKADVRAPIQAAVWNRHLSFFSCLP